MKNGIDFERGDRELISAALCRLHVRRDRRTFLLRAAIDEVRS